MIEKFLEYQRSLLLCLVEIKKAFDRVQILSWKHKIHENFINVIEIKQYPFLAGIQTGHNMNPIVFNIIMDKIINNVKEVKGRYRMEPKSYYFDFKQQQRSSTCIYLKDRRNQSLNTN